VASTETDTRRRQIDLNADVGESFGPWPMGDDERLIPLVSSVNIACGAHAGDPVTIARTVRLALANGVAIGAHPGYPDLPGFGRRDLDMTTDELEASLIVQVGAVQAVARSEGTTIAAAIARLDPALVLVGRAGSALLDAGRAAGLQVRAEGFADRAYEADGSLRDRRKPGAILAPAAAAAQAVAIVRDGSVLIAHGRKVAVDADTICLHGDGPDAFATAIAVRAALADAGIDVSVT